MPDQAEGAADETVPRASMNAKPNRRKTQNGDA